MVKTIPIELLHDTVEYDMSRVFKIAVIVLLKTYYLLKTSSCEL